MYVSKSSLNSKLSTWICFWAICVFAQRLCEMVRGLLGTVTASSRSIESEHSTNRPKGSKKVRITYSLAFMIGEEQQKYTSRIRQRVTKRMSVCQLAPVCRPAAALMVRTWAVLKAATKHFIHIINVHQVFHTITHVCFVQLTAMIC